MKAKSQGLLEVILEMTSLKSVQNLQSVLGVLKIISSEYFEKFHEKIVI